MSLFFTLDDTEYEFDQNRLALAEAVAVKVESGLTIKAFQEGLAEMDPYALKAMVWLAKCRAGVKTRYTDVEFDVVSFAKTLRVEDPPRQLQVVGEQVDPQSGQPTPTGSNNGMTQSAGEPNTSEPSHTT
jgi:hypothetical protein